MIQYMCVWLVFLVDVARCYLFLYIIVLKHCECIVCYVYV